MKRIHHSNQNSHILIDITPETAGWKYISFRVVRLAAGKTIEGDTATNEVVIVPLLGRGRLSCDGLTHDLVRNDLFRELADIAYLPPRAKYKLEGIEPFEIAIGGAPAEGRLPARIIRKEEIATAVRGGSNAARGVSTLLDSDDLTERLRFTRFILQAGTGRASRRTAMILETTLPIMKRRTIIDCSLRTVLQFSAFTREIPI